MATAFEIKNLNFKYPNSEILTLNNLNFTVNQEDFVLICGASGSGKSTLLKHLKPSIAPKGEKSGNILFFSKDLNKLDNRSAVVSIGYLSQYADEQIVCSDPIQELAFGLQNIGLNPDIIKLRIAETVSFFGLNQLIDKNIDSLSGGQKQLLNLASVLIMQPSVLLLDEPTAQLDPLSTSSFIEAVKSANKEFGTTIIISEHKTEGLLDSINRLIVLDSGCVTLNCNPKSSEFYIPPESTVFYSMPSPFKIFTSVCGENNTSFHPPLNVYDGRKWLDSVCSGRKDNSIKIEKHYDNKKLAVELKNIWFRYSRKSPDILKGLSLKIPKNQIFCILGDNASGKTTLLSIISKISSPYSGKVLIDKSMRIGGLFQNPKSMFFKETLLLDLQDTAMHINLTDSTSQINYVAELMEIIPLLKRHPYDLSGGELQRSALAKVLLIKPNLILLDEPSKGIDPQFKLKLIQILQKLKASGITIIIVSHDMDFCARCSDNCAMLFNGEIVSVASSKQFFSQNNFYTTTANKMSRRISKNLITDEDVISFCLENPRR